MSLNPWHRSLLAVTLALAGCKSNNAPAATKDTAAAATTAAAPAANKAPAPVPASVPAISYLKQVDTEQCQWIRQPVSGAPTPVFNFNADCTRTLVSWSPDGKQGVVFTWPVGPGAQPRVWRVDFAAKTGAPMDLKGLPGTTGAQGPDKPYIEKVGFDAQGRPVALVSDVYTDRPLEKGKNGEKFMSFEGERFPVGEVKPDTAPGLALAYRWEDSGWKRFETKASIYEGDDSPGINALDAAKALTFVQRPPPSKELPGKEASVSSGKLLESSLPEQKDGMWMTLPTPGGMLHYRASNLGDDTLVPTAPVRWEQDGKLLELEGLKAKDTDSIGLQLRGELLLISVWSDPNPAYLFDTRTKKNLLSVTGAQSAALWPEPAKP